MELFEQMMNAEVQVHQTPEECSIFAFAENLVIFMTRHSSFPFTTYRYRYANVRNHFLAVIGARLENFMLNNYEFVSAYGHFMRMQLEKNPLGLLDFGFAIVKKHSHLHSFRQFLILAGILIYPIYPCAYLDQTDDPIHRLVIIDVIAFVFNFKIRPRFEAEGGWNEFQRCCAGLKSK